MRHPLLPARALCAAAAVGTSLLACQPDRSPTGLGGPGSITASRSAAASEATLASPGWQLIEANLVAQASLQPVVSARAYSELGVAQYLAVQSAQGETGDRDEDGQGRGWGEGGRQGSAGAAVAGASVVVLSYLFPSKAAALEDTVTAQRNAARSPEAFARGEAIGRAVGAEIVTRAQADGFTTPFTRTIPTGPGLWISNTNPPTIAGGPLPGVRPWFLKSASQFRPGPPPAFGSPDFLAALAEIRQISDTRTAEQIQIATFWAQNAGTPTTPAFWLQVATDNIHQHGYSEWRATHVYALVAAAMFDAQIGCWDAKETYWFIRPWQADPGITTLATVGRPNHPSYPSGHSCLSSAAGTVLGSFFPEQRGQLDSMVIEAGLSRMYAGIHYRFDIEAGRELGRSVAQFAIEADKSGESVLTAEAPEAKR